MRKKSINDSDLLHQTGFIRTFIRHGDVKQSVDYEKLAEFCGVAVRTVRSWKRTGLPGRVRTLLENLLNGAYLPPAWKQAGIRVMHDGVMLRCGTHISLDTISFWQFIVFGVDWARVREIEQTINFYRKNGRPPVVLLQNGVETAKRVTQELGNANSVLFSN